MYGVGFVRPLLHMDLAHVIEVFAASANTRGPCNNSDPDWAHRRKKDPLSIYVKRQKKVLALAKAVSSSSTRIPGPPRQKREVP